MRNNQLTDLAQSLQGCDLGHLHIIASAWDLEDFDAPNERLGLQRLVPLLLDRERFNNVIRELDEAAVLALNDLSQNDGRLPWALFIRRYGEIREMGPARRDRERPHLNPTSVTESLWYRGLIARDFYDSPAGPAEFAYIPAEFLIFMGTTGVTHQETYGSVASASERTIIFPTDDQIVDHACSYLAAIRSGQFDENAYTNWIGHSIPLDAFIEFLRRLLSDAGCLDTQGWPVSDTTRAFLETGRAAGLSFLAQTWLNSKNINDLCLVPGLTCEGEWDTDPLRTRQVILEFVASTPQGQVNLQGSTKTSKPRPPGGSERPFVSLASFVQAVHQAHPDFQRPAGDYDSWFIRQTETNQFLRGFEHWDEVDGALIRFLIIGPLHWLGIVDLAGPSGEGSSIPHQPGAFRLSRMAESLLQGKSPQYTPPEELSWLVQSSGCIIAPRFSSRSARYQIARFCTSEGMIGDGYKYRFTPVSLQRARSQGLNINHLLTMLRRQSKAIPPTLVSALERWEEQGSAAQFERAVVLRTKNPELLQALRTGKAARFLSDPLGPTAVIVKPGAVEAIVNALLEMGYLSEVTFED